MSEVLRVRDLRRQYKTRCVLERISFNVEAGQILALVGLSGCGKTTTLNLIAGLDRPDAGEIEIDGKLVSGANCQVPAHLRGIGMVFQDQLLWPHLTVAEHLDFVLLAQRLPRPERQARIAQQLEAVHLAARRDVRPAQLSGGERQRLGIARALIARPKLLLLDEPCANLDAPLKLEFLELLLSLRTYAGFAAVYVTHDAREIEEVASTIAVLDTGAIVQFGSAEEVFENPAGQAVRRVIETRVIRNPSPSGTRPT